MRRHALVRARARLGCTQVQLGELLGLDAAAVHRLERGLRSPRGLVLEILRAIVTAQARGVDLAAAVDRAVPRGARLLVVLRGAYGP